MKNKKEIDMIVEVLERFATKEHNRKKYCLNINLYYRDIATSILTKLKENEIVFGSGRLMAFSLNELFIEFKKGCIHIFNREDLYKFKGKNIILTARVVKDE